MNPETRTRSTTVIAVSRDGRLAMASDGQVTVGSTVMKHGAEKVRKASKHPALIGFAYPSTGNFIAFVGNTGSGGLVRRVVGTFRDAGRFPAEGAAVPGFLGAGLSDNWSFAKVGYDSLMVTDTAPFRYQHYHRLTDTVDKIDFDKISRVARLVVRMLDGLQTDTLALD